MELEGLKVLVGRQPQHTQDLMRSIIDAGGEPICQPLFDVEPCLSEKDLNQLRQQANDFDIAIFVSRNAVDKVFEYLPEGIAWRWASIGEGTARALQGLGVSEVLYPNVPAANSRELLGALKEQMDIDGKQIVIFTGADGDRWLEEGLINLGAKVKSYEVYRRIMPKDRNLQIEGAVILITCVTSLKNLHAISSDLSLPILVVSKRIQDVALEMGYTNVYTSNSMADVDILSALKKVASDAR